MNFLSHLDPVAAQAFLDIACRPAAEGLNQHGQARTAGAAPGQNRSGQCRGRVNGGLAVGIDRVAFR